MSDLVNKLRYRSHYRGCRENDHLLGGFADKYLVTFTEKQLIQFADILELEDNDLLSWMLGYQPVPPKYCNEVMMLLLEYAKVQAQHSI